MTILSIDVGVKNLAFCAYDPDTKTIHDWKLVTVQPQVEGVVAQRLVEEMNDAFPDTKEFDRVVIERQPGRNLRIKAVENYLHMYFLMRGNKTYLYNPLKKLASCPGKTYRGGSGAMYRERKRASVALCRAWLKDNEGNDDNNARWRAEFERVPKRDDLADALAQVLSYCGQGGDVPDAEFRSQEASSVVRARKPTAKQLRTGNLSRSNLKHMLNVEWKDEISCAEDAVACIRKHPKAAKAVSRLYAGDDDACVTHLWQK